MAEDSRPLSRRARFEVLRRDGFTCRYCGGKAPDVELTVDHVIPQALGGSNDPSNLVAACSKCNGGKGSTSPDEITVQQVDEMAERYSAAMQRAIEIERLQREPERTEEINAAVEWWAIKCGHYTYTPSDIRGSMSSFLDAGLTLDDITYALNQTRDRRKPFPYFAGICWTIVRRRNDIAVEILRQS